MDLAKITSIDLGLLLLVGVVLWGLIGCIEQFPRAREYDEDD